MKIRQNPGFKPITITFETAAEAAALRTILGMGTGAADRAASTMAREISDWLNKAVGLDGK